MKDVAPEGTAELLIVGCANCVRLCFRIRGIFLHDQSEHFTERRGITAKTDVLILIHDAAEERHDQIAAILDIAIDILNSLFIDQIQVRCNDKFVTRQVRFG